MLSAVVVAGVAIFDTLFRRDTGKSAAVSAPLVASLAFLPTASVSFVVNEDDFVKDGVVPVEDEVAATPLISSSPSTIAASTAFRFLVRGGVMKTVKKTWRSQDKDVVR
jgi:hypothetical protein